MGRTPQSQLRKRRNKVKKMLVRGITQEQMADSLDVSRRTIARDIDAIKNEVKEKVKEEPIEEVLTDLEATLDVLRKEYWKIYHDNEASHTTKLRALKNINDSVENRIKLLQKLGIVRKEADKLEISESRDRLKEVYEELEQEGETYNKE